MGGATQSGDLQAFWIAEYFLTREDIDVDLLRELVASHESVFGDRRIQIRLLLRGARTAWEEQAEAHHVLTFLEQLEDIGANPLPSHMLKTLVRTQIMLQHLRRDPMGTPNKAAPSARFLASLEQYFPKAEDGARHPTGELLEQAASSSQKLNEMLRDNSRDEVTTALEQYTDTVLKRLGPSFLERVEQDVLERKYMPGAAPPPPARESNQQTDYDAAEAAAEEAAAEAAAEEAAAAAIASMASPSLGGGGGAGGSVAAVSPSMGQPSARKRPRDDDAGPSTQAPNESGEDTEDDEASQRPHQTQRLHQASKALLRRGVDPLLEVIQKASTVRMAPHNDREGASDEAESQGGASLTPLERLRLPSLANTKSPSPLEPPAAFSTIKPTEKAKPTRKKVRWSPEEEAAFARLVEIEGQGNWAKVLSEGQSNGVIAMCRSAVDLKDKWRNMQKKMMAG